MQKILVSIYDLFLFRLRYYTDCCIQAATMHPGLIPRIQAATMHTGWYTTHTGCYQTTHCHHAYRLISMQAAITIFSLNVKMLF